MTDIEERLRHDLKKRSERARPGSIRPLRVPSASRRSRARYRLASARRSRAARVLAPATAIIAVIAIIAGVWMAGHPGGKQPATAGSSAGMPKYYVTLKTALRGKMPVQDGGAGRSRTGPRDGDRAGLAHLSTPGLGTDRARAAR